MRRLFREPLLHFVLLGIGLFALDAFLRDRRSEPRAGEIVVSAGRIENMAALFTKTWQRPPTPREMRGLIDDFVLEEALYREGVALGVDQDDTIIRRRVRQKMAFIVDDLVDLDAPTEAELGAWLAEHPDSYTRPARFTFRQVYLNPRRRTDAEAEARLVLEKLRSTQDVREPSDWGDASLLEQAYADADADLVARTFGEGFAERLAALPLGRWSGPVESPFGIHLVILDERVESRIPPLSEVHDAVVRDWSFARREAASEAFYQELIGRYQVTIEWPRADGAADRDPASEDTVLAVEKPAVEDR